MAFQSALYYWLTCDQDTCDRRSTENSDYAAWAQPDAAVAEASESEWWTRDGKHYCYEHVPTCPTCGLPLDQTTGTCPDHPTE
jgi:hypothetical protein